MEDNVTSSDMDVSIVELYICLDGSPLQQEKHLHLIESEPVTFHVWIYIVE